MSKTISLGGGIELVGFDELSLAHLTVVKKLVGAYARTFTDQSKDYDSLKISLLANNPYQIESMCRKQSAKSKHDNVFMALGDSLNKLEKKLEK